MSDTAGLHHPSRLTRRFTPDRRVFTICAAMVGGVAVALWLTPDRTTSTLPSAWWVWIVVTVLYALLEYIVFTVQFQREGIVFSLSEIANALALVFLAPGVALVSRLLGTVPVLIVPRRNRGAKLVFNTVLFALELSVMYPVFRWLLQAFGDGNARRLAALLITETTVMPMMGVLTALAISQYEGAFLQRVRSGIGSSWWYYSINSVLAVMAVAFAMIEPVLTVIVALPVGALWFVMVRYGELAQQLRDLEATHGFAGRVGHSLELDEITSAAVEESMHLMRADAAALVRFTDTDEPEVRSIGSIPVRLPDHAGDASWSDVIAGGTSSILLPGDIRTRGLGLRKDLPTLVAAPVDDGEGAIGLLVLAAWDNQVLRFDERARARAQSLAEQLSASLRKGLLHERLEWEARHDALTGLPARTLFERRVAEVVRAVADADDGVWSVMMLDLDRFKEVNDTLGHHAGDALLVEFSRRMTALLQNGDVLARLAGDEFAILYRRASFDEVEALANECVRSGGRPVTLDGLEIVVTVSVGVSMITPADEQAIQPIRRADIAMYNAKWQRSGVELYREEIDRRTPARLSMLGDLRAAIEQDELDVVYQPKLDLASGRIVGCEALVRWQHDGRGTVPPQEFVRVAEDTGLIKQLTDIVLASGIAKLADFAVAGLDLGLAVNVSTHDLFDTRLAERVQAYLESHGVNPALLTLEITESSLFVDAPRTRATIDDLHAVGLRMAVDDFGTGYSSLSYLRRLPVHELKIDQSFVARMLVDPQDEVIVRSTVDLGHNLDLSVVAEGVESFAVLDRLREIGCDVAQGYAISQPVGADHIVEWVRESSRRAWQNAID